MGDISLEPGETKKIISQPGTGEAYNITVENADVYLSHTKSRVRNSGKHVRPGDRPRVDNLRGKSLFAKNPKENTEDATLNVDRAGFNLVFQPRAVIGAVRTGAGNEAAPANDEDQHDSATDVDLAAGTATETVNMPDAADTLNVAVKSNPDAPDAETGSFKVVVTWQDDDGNDILSFGPDDSAEFSGTDTNAIQVVNEAFGPGATVEVVDTSGQATNRVDYSVYAR